VPLGTEHAVPYGLNGPWTLLRASCDVCARITSRFEHGAMRQLWPDVRNALAMQSRRRDKRSTTLPLVIQRDGVRETIQVPRTSFPTYLPTPIFPPPAATWANRRVPGVFTNLEMIHICGPTFAEASKEYPGHEFFGMHLNFSAEDFVRMLAKIASAPQSRRWGSAHLRTLLLETSSQEPTSASATGLEHGGTNRSMARMADCTRSG
jgi:hypothetical protein